MTDQNVHNNTPLRDIVAERLQLHWPTFADEHPQLAAAIEQIKLIDAVVEKLADQPAYRVAMQAAGNDEQLLSAAASLVKLIDTQVRQLLGL